MKRFLAHHDSRWSGWEITLSGSETRRSALMKRSTRLNLVLGRPTLGPFPWLDLGSLGIAWSLSVTKKEIVKTISEEIGMTQLKTKEIVQKTFDAIVESLVEERRIELRNFGVFEVKRRAARKARNPRTGDHVVVPAKFVVVFKPGKEMEERVLQLEKEENARMQLELDEELAGQNQPAPPQAT